MPADRAEIGYTPRLQRPLAAWVEDGRLALYDWQQSRRIATAVAVDRVTATNGRLLAQQGAMLYQVELLELPAGIQAALTPLSNVLPNATCLYDGVAIQDVLGTWHATVSPRPGTGYVLPLSELAGTQVVNARYENQVLFVVVARQGSFDRYCYRFDPEFRSRDLQIERDVSNPELNAVVLESGVALLLNDQGDLELFPNRPGRPARRIISDPNLPGSRLFRCETQLLLACGKTLFSGTLSSSVESAAS
ncbi:MAG: hypothetical protein FJX77_13660 [Armatimonadetes bacterium]|nr:hypothetical protein [Armatimonadota bacterium]